MFTQLTYTYKPKLKLVLSFLIASAGRGRQASFTQY